MRWGWLDSLLLSIAQLRPRIMCPMPLSVHVTQPEKTRRYCSKHEKQRQSELGDAMSLAVCAINPQYSCFSSCFSIPINNKSTFLMFLILWKLSSSATSQKGNSPCFQIWETISQKISFPIYRLLCQAYVAKGKIRYTFLWFVVNWLDFPCI